MSGVLVDTCVWVDHFKRRNDTLVDLLASDRVLSHPMIVGELACGTPPFRRQTLLDLEGLQPVRQASIREVMDLVERDRLFGLGCGVVDLMLLASARMTPGVVLWTLDRRLNALAQRYGMTHPAARL
ncbi:type II toxin-antitoxin system VapC family toxin [Sphaerotilus mobilis]|uniref:PIN domain-containing protein n=1 Tax=Sphaerotilus mobilis TaxID=47994 RepID=A0A4Q7LAG3_9BURK|nr:PIN domain-containing protein [Sphaerotilus mobilis]RZS47489.1 hypothetical protein EV685_3694 [Sphaerotilus mobilis]